MDFDFLGNFFGGVGGVDDSVEAGRGDKGGEENEQV
jgi:hypothetical protein